MSKIIFDENMSVYTNKNGLGKAYPMVKIIRKCLFPYVGKQVRVIIKEAKEWT